MRQDVHKIMGYARFESLLAKDAMNDLYKNELRFFQNVFQPSVKLLKKVRRGARLTRVYDTPKTPWQRVLLSKYADPQKVKELRFHILRLDPFKLSDLIDKKLGAIQKLVARGPAPKPSFHPAWGRKKISDIGTISGIPSSTGTPLKDNSVLDRITENLRKECFLQTF